MKTAYNYDKDTLEYIGQEECQIDPLESELQQKEIYIYPANSTLIEPPKIPDDGKKYAIVYNKEKDNWDILEDNRGVEYWLLSENNDVKIHNMKESDDCISKPYVMKCLGPLPDDATTIKPEIIEQKEKEINFINLRKMREHHLYDSDWAILPDSPLSEEKKKEWIEYRQKLRDLTTLEGAPWDGGGDKTPWPKKPSN